MTEIEDLIDDKKEYQSYLYQRGYLITTDYNIDLSVYPFYGNWSRVMLEDFAFCIHNNQKLYYFQNDSTIWFLIGHAYNPFSLVKDEQDILNYLASCDEAVLFDSINEISGNYLLGRIKDDRFDFVSDASCMLTAYYGSHNGKLYISQYSQLIGDICNIEQDEYIKDLVNYRFYHLFGRMLPGDLSPYCEFKHTIPNFYYSYSLEKNEFLHKRFYPVVALDQSEVISEKRYAEIINIASDILHKSLELISEKWSAPAISLTGGCDSKTTLSCANGLYDKFSYYSYTSSESENVDAVAAGNICSELGLSHRVDEIPDDDSSYGDIEVWRNILRQNCGNIGENNSNDVRKRIYYVNEKHFDIEVKSWVSEIARAYYSKRFDDYKFPKYPTPRYLSSMYKVFLGNRKLLKETDAVFSGFLDNYYTDDVFEMINWVDLLFWEYRVSSWNGLVISNEHSLSYDIAIPYNNRKLLDLFLSTPQSYRICDKCHKDIQHRMNPKIADSSVSVVNLKHTNKRAKIEKLYLYLISLF